MEVTSLKPLNINTQKDEIIARLILQKAILYVDYTEGWLDNFLSSKEAYHVYKYAIAEDKKTFNVVYDEIVKLINDGVFKEDQS